MIGGGLESHSSASTSTHDVQHDVVAQAGGAVDADQDPVFDGGAEAHGQPVRPSAWPLIIGPGVGDQAPSLPKDVGGARCGDRERKGIIYCGKNKSGSRETEVFRGRRQIWFCDEQTSLTRRWGAPPIRNQARSSQR